MAQEQLFADEYKVNLDVFEGPLDLLLYLVKESEINIYDIPIVENRPLARSLYAETQVGDIIPDDYINAIVLVYKQIDYISKRRN